MCWPRSILSFVEVGLCWQGSCLCSWYSKMYLCSGMMRLAQFREVVCTVTFPSFSFFIFNFLIRQQCNLVWCCYSVCSNGQSSALDHSSQYWVNVMLNKGEKFLKISTSCKAFNRIRMLDFFFFWTRVITPRKKKSSSVGKSVCPCKWTCSVMAVGAQQAVLPMN